LQQMRVDAARHAGSLKSLRILNINL